MVALNGPVLLCEMRPGVKSVTPADEDRLMLELQAPFPTEMANRCAKWNGPLEQVVVSYRAFYELHVPLDENLVVVILEKDIPFAEIPEVARKIKDLSQ